MRAFLALQLPEALLSALMDRLKRVKSELSCLPIRWVPQENIHVTLKFLADLPQDKLTL